MRQALFTDLIYQPGHCRMYKTLSVRCQRYKKKKKKKTFLCSAIHKIALLSTVAKKRADLGEESGYEEFTDGKKE